MAYLIFETDNAKKGDMYVARLTTSAIFNYQVLGGTVKFLGSNVPDVRPEDRHLWCEILTLKDGEPDTEPFRQHAWNNICYEVLEGENVGIYVSSGVAG